MATTQGQPGLVPLCQKVRKHAKGGDWQVVVRSVIPALGRLKARESGVSIQPGLCRKILSQKLKPNK